MPMLPPVDTVVVTAPRLPPLGGDLAFDVQRIAPEVLAAAPRLDAALRQTPGVSLFRRTGSDAANPTIQGISLRAIAPSGAGRALVTLDGAPQNDSFGGWVIWSALPPEALESATLVRGAGAGPYGAGALTGVIALQETARAEGLSRLDVALAQRGGARLAAVAGTDHLLISAARETSDGYVPVRAGRGPADSKTDLDGRSFSLRLQGALGPTLASLRVGAYDERRGAGLVGARSRAQGASAALTLARLEAGRGWRVQAWTRISDLANSSAAVSAGRTISTPASDQFATPASGYGLNAAWQDRGAVWSWELGADVRSTQGKAKERFRYQNGAFTRGRVSGGETLVGGVYAEAVRDQGPLLLSGGVRLDAWRQDHAVRREYDLATGAPTLDVAAPDKTGVVPTARLGARWTVSPGLWLRSAAYAGFRPPTLNELHRPFRVGNDVTEANPDLEPERLLGLEVGIGGQGRLTWSATAFLNRLDDPVTNVTVGVGPATFPTAGFIPAGGTLRQRRNAGRINASGLEFEVERRFENGSLRAAGAWTRARVDGGAQAPQLTGLRPAQAPALTATAGAEWRPAPRLSLSAQARLESSRFEDDLNTRRLSAGVGLDARAAWRVGETAAVYLLVENLTDAALEVGETGDGVESFAAPRTLRIGVSISR